MGRLLLDSPLSRGGLACRADTARKHPFPASLPRATIMPRPVANYPTTPSRNDLVNETPKPAISPRLAYWLLAALFAMNLLNYIDRYILAAVLKPMQETLGFQGDDTKAGFLSAIFVISFALFSPVMGWLGDRMTRKYLLVIGIGVWSLATFGSGLARTYGEALFARSLLGIGEATYTTLAPTLIADLFPRAQRNRALAIFYVAIPVGAALGYVLGGQIVAHHESLHFLPRLEDAIASLTGQHFTNETGRGWRMAFFLVGLPGLLVAVAAFFLPEPKRGATEEVDEEHRQKHDALSLSWRDYLRLAHNRSYVYNTFAMAMLTFALGGLQFFTPKFLASGENGMSLEDANMKLGVAILLAGLIGTPLGSWLGDIAARRWSGGFFLMSGVSMLVSVPFILVALLAALWGWPLVFFGIATGVTLAMLNYGPSNAIIINVNVPKIRAAAFAVNILMIHLLGDIPSPYLMGVVSDAVRPSDTPAGEQIGLFWGLLITIPALVASGVLFLMGTRHLERDQDAVLKEMQHAGD